MNIENYVTFDEPVPYRGLKLYPIKIIDYGVFSGYSQCLLIEKNHTRDVNIISMSDLEYLYYSSENNSETPPYLLFFDRLLSLCLREDESFNKLEKSVKRYKYDERGKPFFEISGEKYTDKDFNIIKEIVAEQNLLELPDPSISKEVKDSLERAREYKNRQRGFETGSFEDHIIAMSVATGWTIEYIYSLTIRKFIKSIQRLDNLIHYKIYLNASMSGFVEFKDKSLMKHWMASLENKDKYSDVSVDLDEVKGKVSLESAKK